MIISVLKDLKIFDAGSKTGVDEVVKKIEINSSSVTLNLSRCIIDYPATSTIMDKILTGLLKQKAYRILIIQTHLNIIEVLLLHWLFIGSKFLDIDDANKKDNLEDFKTNINKSLKKNKTIIKLQVLDKNEKIIKEYKYGG